MRLSGRRLIADDEVADLHERVVPLEPTVVVLDGPVGEQLLPAPLGRVRHDPPDAALGRRGRERRLEAEEPLVVGEEAAGVRFTAPLRQPPHGEATSVVRLARARWAVEDDLALARHRALDLAEQRLGRRRDQRLRVVLVGLSSARRGCAGSRPC